MEEILAMRTPKRDKEYLDRSLPIPLYFQISEQLRRRMIEKKMSRGDLLTTDELVQEEFNVSRATAR